LCIFIWKNILRDWEEKSLNLLALKLIMTDLEKRIFFSENGYLLIPGILSVDEVLFMRKRVLEVFENGEWKKSKYSTEKVLSEIYDYFPEFIKITLSQKVLHEIKNVLGENPILMPETAIHHKFYPGWHKDTTSQERAGYNFHLKPESLMMEAGFYLQDNDEFGGGLTVMKGSHKTSDNFAFQKEKKRTLLTRIKNRLMPVDEKDNQDINPYKHEIVEIPSKVGDLVFFNLKTNHRASLPKKIKIEDIPKEKEKLAFFNAFSSNNSTAIDYLNYIKSRPEPFYQSLHNKIISNDFGHWAKETGFIVY
jgi:hypothetical protein